MPSLTGFKKRFTHKWWLTVLAFIVILFFMRLGFWQLERAAEKKEILARVQAFAAQKPVLWSPNKENPSNYQKIKLSGHFLPTVFFLDNQFHNHQFGYHIFSLLLLSDQQIALVDRGWTAGDITRKNLPDVMTPSGLIEVKGTAYYPSTKKITLGQMIEKNQNDRIIIEWIDTKAIGHILQKSVYPFIIRLDKNEPYGFIRQWPLVSMPPERHYAYALQWFSMAAVVFIIFIALSFKKKS